MLILSLLPAELCIMRAYIGPLRFDMADKNNFIGKQIGSYLLVEKIGKGGYGSVYRAEHTILTNRIVAIKLLQEVLFNSDQERDRFKEAIVLETLQHPNILHLIDVGVDEDLLY